MVEDFSLFVEFLAKSCKKDKKSEIGENRLLDCRLKAVRGNEKLEIGDMRSEVSEKQAEAV